MFSMKSLILVFTVFVFCEAGYVDSLDKCKINDGSCAKKNVQTTLREHWQGVPELGIPQLDPIEVNDITVAVLEVINITMIKGTVKGIKNCIVNKFVTKIEDEKAYMDLTCDITLKGRYKLSSTGPAIESLFGGPASGDGNVKIKMDKLNIKFIFNFFIQNRDGEKYLKCKSDKMTYTYNVKGVTFYVDNLYIGKEESSKQVTGLMNQNWRPLLASFGKPFMDKSMEFVYIFWHKFFDAVPCRHYISDDLTPYARDN